MVDLQDFVLLTFTLAKKVVATEQRTVMRTDFLYCLAFQLIDAAL